MPALDAIRAMQAAVYAEHGVGVVWTPAGGAPVPLTGLVDHGDRTGDVQGVGSFVTPVASIRVRVAEVVANAPTGVLPLEGDAIEIDDPAGPAVSYLIGGAPERQDPRRLEFTLELAVA